MKCIILKLTRSLNFNILGLRKNSFVDSLHCILFTVRTAHFYRMKIGSVFVLCVFPTLTFSSTCKVIVIILTSLYIPQYSIILSTFVFDRFAFIFFISIHPLSSFCSYSSILTMFTCSSCSHVSDIAITVDLLSMFCKHFLIFDKFQLRLSSKN